MKEEMQALVSEEEVSLFGFQGAGKGTLHAPLAQLVEHLTLNQGVQGSSP